VSDAGFTVERGEAESGGALVTVRGELRFAEAARAWSELRAQVLPVPSGGLIVDLSEVERIDGGCMALLLELIETARCSCSEGGTVELRGAQGSVAEILTLYEREPADCINPEPKAESTLAQIGAGTAKILAETKVALGFVGGMVRAVGAALRNPSGIPWRNVFPLAERAGADGLPIVLLIGFLVGFIMAFQGAAQLRQFGADIFVANLVALTVTRELGPLMTAIIVAGRSGAAFAAELGTMKVNEEIDALSVLGLDPLAYLVVPRLLALLFALPILALVADLMGLTGGLLVGILGLDLSPTAYIKQTQSGLAPWDVFSGIFKTFAFALAIGLIACQQGLATSGGAQGVGQRTTRAVVTILFFLILIDAGFAIAFNALGL